MCWSSATRIIKCYFIVSVVQPTLVSTWTQYRYARDIPRCDDVSLSGDDFCVCFAFCVRHGTGGGSTAGRAQGEGNGGAASEGATVVAPGLSYAGVALMPLSFLLVSVPHGRLNHHQDFKFP